MFGRNLQLYGGSEYGFIDSSALMLIFCALFLLTILPAALLKDSGMLFSLKEPKDVATQWAAALTGLIILSSFAAYTFTDFAHNDTFYSISVNIGVILIIIFMGLYMKKMTDACPDAQKPKLAQTTSSTPAPAPTPTA